MIQSDFTEATVQLLALPVTFFCYRQYSVGHIALSPWAARSFFRVKHRSSTHANTRSHALVVNWSLSQTWAADAGPQVLQGQTQRGARLLCSYSPQAMSVSGMTRRRSTAQVCGSSSGSSQPCRLTRQPVKAGQAVELQSQPNLMRWKASSRSSRGQ